MTRARDLPIEEQGLRRRLSGCAVDTRDAAADGRRRKQKAMAGRSGRSPPTHSSSSGTFCPSATRGAPCIRKSATAAPGRSDGRAGRRARRGPGLRREERLDGVGLLSGPGDGAPDDSPAASRVNSACPSIRKARYLTRMRDVIQCTVSNPSLGPWPSWQGWVPELEGTEFDPRRSAVCSNLSNAGFFFLRMYVFSFW